METFSKEASTQTSPIDIQQYDADCINYNSNTTPDQMCQIRADHHCLNLKLSLIEAAIETLNIKVITHDSENAILCQRLSDQHKCITELQTNTEFWKSLACLTGIIDFIEMQAISYIYKCNSEEIDKLRAEFSVNSSIVNLHRLAPVQLSSFHNFCRLYVDPIIGNWQNYIQATLWFKQNRSFFCQPAIFRKEYSLIEYATRCLHVIANTYRSQSDNVHLDDVNRQVLNENGQKIIEIAYQNWHV